MSGFNMGLTAPMVSMGMTDPRAYGGAPSGTAGGPAGGILQAPRGEEWQARGGRYTSLELMNR